MKRKGICIGILIFAFLLLIASVSAFVEMYHDPIEITKTKLQYYVFDSYENGVIHCSGDKHLLLDSVAMELFDSAAFTKQITKGDQFFARVQGAALAEDQDEIYVYSVVDGSNEYLSLDALNISYQDQSSMAAIILAIGMVISIALIVIGLILFFKPDHKNRHK